MHILIFSDEPAFVANVTTILQGAGHVVEPWSPSKTLPKEAGLVIVDGMDGVVEAHEVPVHILVAIEPSEIALFPESPRQVSDFCIKPINSEDLKGRVAIFATKRSWIEQARDELLAMAVENTSDIVELASPEGVLEYVNPAYQTLLGIAPAEAVGKTPAQLVRSDAHSPEFFRELDETLKRGLEWTGTIVSRSRSGRLVHFDTTITPISDSKGRISHHMAVKRDITEQLARRQALVEANRALEKARDAALSASRAKSEFVANMSHELRTPLNAVIGYSEMLIEDLEDENKDAVKDLQRIHAAGTHLLALINDVLDISKIEAEKVELSPENFPLAELVDAVAETVRPLAQRNNNTFEIRIPDELGSAYTDATRLKQILFNLLSNACKFTNDGQVTLEVTRKSEGARAWFEFKVQDTGIGISDEHQEKLFQAFVQADSSTTRKYGGTGLGLVISKRFVEIMGGEISMRSELGAGSTFTVRIPAVEGGQRALLAKLPRGGALPSVLLIDDDIDIRDLFERVLSQRGFKVHVANNGEHGIEMARSLRPDVIVLDVKMPSMSGWDVLSSLKLGANTADIPVIMLTVMQQQELGYALGAVDYLMKPIESSTLVRTLRKYVQQETTRVLVVEDDEATSDFIRRTLEHAGHTVFVAENGAAAMLVLENSEPHVVILDLMMPVMDGFTFLQLIRAQKKYESLPVIVATARELSEAERRELEATTQRIVEKNSHGRRELLDIIGSQIEFLLSSNAGQGA